LAWLLDFSPGLNRPVLYHGSHVELFASGFFEGAWDAEFTLAGFDRSANVFGSGAKFNDATISIVPPSHTLEPLVLFSGDRRNAVSNSLGFLSAYCAVELKPIDWRSGERFAAIAQGLDHAVERFQLSDGLLTILYHHNFVVANSTVHEVAAKPLPPRFTDFDSYYGYLLDTARQICANAGHEARVRQYEPLTTVSSGYDSAAGAVIAAAVGCRKAVTLRCSQHGDSDSGAQLAKVLGLELREFERVDHISQIDLSAAEFLSAGTQGEDYVYHVFQDLLPGKVLFTGFVGGMVWEKNRPPTDKLHRKDLSGSSLGEFRLSRDFLHLPVPCIGSLRHPDIYRIAHSAEMASYSIGGEYDRPIPRRIVESAGVPGEVFGQKKRATGLIFYRKPELISPKGHPGIVVFEKGLGISSRDRARAAVLRVRWRFGLALFHGFKRLTSVRGSRIPAVKILRPVGRVGIAVLSRVLGPYEVFEHGNPRNVIWHQWALSRVKQCYVRVPPRVADDLQGI
jgi:hypothetical protein